MPVHSPTNKRGVYFITFTCFNRHPLTELTKGYDLVYRFFDVLKQQGNPVPGFVIMPNHVHLLVHYTSTGQSLNTITGNGKRFIGYGIVQRLAAMKQTALLEQMQRAVGDKDRQRNKKHQLWQGSFDVKQCRTEQFLLQKLSYIHSNPCSGKWRLSESPHLYEHSSAGYYSGRHTGYAVTDYETVLAELKWELNE